ncbi:MAG: exodeoxyribonuclease VII small subunit [Lachnospiraceae bacterium]|nr:exodeoxyribonuclease VII small subunit [Lachnospiraceae bacterium]
MSEAQDKQIQDMSIEEAFEQLDRLCEQLENPTTTLEAAFAAYQEGMKLVKGCTEKIDLTEKQVMQLMQDGSQVPL